METSGLEGWLTRLITLRDEPYTKSMHEQLLAAMGAAVDGDGLSVNPRTAHRPRGRRTLPHLTGPPAQPRSPSFDDRRQDGWSGVRAVVQSPPGFEPG